MRLIDADALKEFIDDCGICAICPQKAPRCSYDCDFPDFVTEKWNVAIDAQPTIDAVEVVRCAECAYCNVQNTKYLYAICERHGIEFKPFEDDTRTHSCSWGERRADE